MKDYRFGSDNVVSVSSACGDPVLRESIIASDFIRSETLRRCLAIPSYQFKSSYWKSRYYDLIRRKVMEELSRK